MGTISVRNSFDPDETLSYAVAKVIQCLAPLANCWNKLLRKGTSARPAAYPRRLPNHPKLYFPPIGVRLVKKYIGIDLKQKQSFSDYPPVKDKKHKAGTNDEGPRLSKTFRSTVKKDHIPLQKISMDNSPRSPINEELDKEEAQEFNTDDKTKCDQEILADTTATRTQDRLIRNEERLDTKYQIACGNKTDMQISVEIPVYGLQKDENKLANIVDVSVPETDQQEKPKYEDNETFIDGNKQRESVDRLNVTPLVSTRRSSRSTFRKRISARFPSKSTVLRKHNETVIENSHKGQKVKSGVHVSFAEPKKFFLDYGDGKLHSTMEIPKTKDCARTWCNPSCKTCQNRVTGNPCFLLIPAGSAKQQNMLLLQKRRASEFPVLKEKSSLSDALVTSPVPVNMSDKTDFGDNSFENVEKNNEGHDASTDDENDASNNDEEDIGEYFEDDNEWKKEAVIRIEKMLHINRDRQNRGCDIRRIKELGLPKGGPSAEVRFSKMSLRRKQEQLKEKARTQQLSEIEKENLTMIQGKISVFLALLNQCENTCVPKKMVHLPIREDVYIQRRKPKPRRLRFRESLANSDRIKNRLLS